MPDPTATANPVDMNGWHTAGALYYSDVNKAIADQGLSPTSWSETAPDGSASASGEFGTWSLAKGGSGPLLMLSIPLTSGTVTIGTGSPATLTAATATVIVHAQFMPQPGATQSQILQLKSQAAASNLEIASVENITPPQEKFLNQAALKQLLETWLNANLEDFNHTFATVNMNTEFANAGVAWLQPSHIGYAVAEPELNPTPENSVFAVLCLIDGEQSATGLVEQVSPYAIPPGAQGGFVIAPEKFLQHMMLATVPFMFQGVSTKPADEYFQIDNAGTRISNTQPLTMAKTKLENGNIVEPTVKAGDFTIQIDTTELVITATAMTFEYSPGITVSLNYTGRSKLSYDATKGILDLAVTTQNGSGSVSISKGLQIAEIVLSLASIVLAAVGAVGGVVGRTANSAVTTATEAALGAAKAEGEDAAAIENLNVTALRGLISGTPAEVTQIAGRFIAVAKVAGIGAFATTLMPAITEILQAVADGDYQSMPKITDLTDAAIGEAIQWPTTIPNLTLSTAQLNGAMQFGLKASS